MYLHFRQIYTVDVRNIDCVSGKLWELLKIDKDLIEKTNYEIIRNIRNVWSLLLISHLSFCKNINTIYCFQELINFILNTKILHCNE